jgi:hypothetical protein
MTVAELIEVLKKYPAEAKVDIPLEHSYYEDEPSLSAATIRMTEKDFGPVVWLGYPIDRS